MIYREFQIPWFKFAKWKDGWIPKRKVLYSFSLRRVVLEIFIEKHWPRPLVALRASHWSSLAQSLSRQRCVVERNAKGLFSSKSHDLSAPLISSQTFETACIYGASHHPPPLWPWGWNSRDSNRCKRLLRVQRAQRGIPFDIKRQKNPSRIKCLAFVSSSQNVLRTLF